MSKATLVMLSALAVGIAGCGKKPTPPPPAAGPPATSTPAPPPAPATAPAGVTVTQLTVGNAIGADRKVTSGSSTLGRNDTLFVSVDTTGVGTATLRARWTYQPSAEATLVKEETQTIEANGPATSEFHIDKPDGWPAGEYQVEVFVNDAPAGSRRFTVN